MTSAPDRVSAATCDPGRLARHPMMLGDDGDGDDDDTCESAPAGPPGHPMELPATEAPRGSAMARAGHQIHEIAHRTRARLEHLPRPARMGIALLFIVGGIAGVLPVLGFWMVPVGLAILAMDVPPLERAWHRLKARFGRRQLTGEDEPD